MKRNIKGFTLLELMMTLAVLAVMLSLGVPAMANIRQQAQASAAISLLTTSLATARILAISRNRPVTVCPSQDGSTCRRDLTWDAGWIVYLDAARERQPASVDDVLHRTDNSNGVAIHSTPGRHLVRYLPDGRSSGSNVTLSLCSRSTTRLIARVKVNNAGRPYSERLASPVACPYDS